jgi:hypothetical protein
MFKRCAHAREIVVAAVLACVAATTGDLVKLRTDYSAVRARIVRRVLPVEYSLQASVIVRIEGLKLLEGEL